jgi:hypothetical protein
MQTYCQKKSPTLSRGAANFKNTFVLVQSSLINTLLMTYVI